MPHYQAAMFQNVTLSDIYESPLQTLMGNPMVSGALYLMILGGISGLFWTITRLFYQKLKNFIWVSVTLESSDPLFYSLQLWLSSLSETHSASHIEAFSTNNPNNPFSQRGRGHRRGPMVDTQTSETSPSVYFMPSVGYILIKFKGKWIWVSRNKTQVPQTQNNSALLESITLFTIGRSTEILKEAILESYKLGKKLDKGNTVVYTWCTRYDNGQWIRTLTKPIRPWESVKLNGNISNNLFEDVERFIRSKEIYQGRGIPHRRGFLLYGPPGTGKTSVITALAGKLHYNIATLSLSNALLTDDALVYALSTLPPETILLLEDIDAVFTKEESTSATCKDNGDSENSNLGAIRRGRPVNRNNRDMNSGGLSFSGLLNALDGVSTSEGRLMFMTTNHKEVLDAALIRPGRVDREVLIDVASGETIVDMFRHFYSVGNEFSTKEMDFLCETLSERLSQFILKTPMASIQNHFLTYMSDPQEAISMENLQQIFQLA